MKLRFLTFLLQGKRHCSLFFSTAAMAMLSLCGALWGSKNASFSKNQTSQHKLTKFLYTALDKYVILGPYSSCSCCSYSKQFRLCFIAPAKGILQRSPWDLWGFSRLSAPSLCLRSGDLAAVAATIAQRYALLVHI